MPLYGIEDFNENGFAVIDGLFDDNEVNEMMKAIGESQPVKDHFSANPDGFAFHLLEITTMNEVFLKYACHPKIINYIKQILGEDIQLQHSKLTVKMPGKKKGDIPWHQDFAYLPHTNTSLLAVMICLVDFTPENGCMKMVKGSHKYGLLNHRDSNGYEADCTDASAWADKSKIVEITPKRGGVSIHHCMTLHSSGDQFSNTPRYSMAFQYRARDSYQLADKVWEDTGLVVSGKDDSPLDIRLEAIKIPLIKSHRYLDSPFGSAFNQIGASVKNRRLVSPFWDRKPVVKKDDDLTKGKDKDKDNHQNPLTLNKVSNLT